MALLCCAQARSDLVIEVREIAGYGEYPARRMPCRITHLERIAPDVVIVTLQLPAKERLQYRAGQFLEFTLGEGARRCYSIATAPHAEGRSASTCATCLAASSPTRCSGRPASRSRSATSCAWKGPWGPFFCARPASGPSYCSPAEPGFAPIKAIAETIFHLQLNTTTRQRAPGQIGGAVRGRGAARPARARAARVVVVQLKVKNRFGDGFDRRESGSAGEQYDGPLAGRAQKKGPQGPFQAQDVALLDRLAGRPEQRVGEDAARHVAHVDADRLLGVRSGGDRVAAARALAQRELQELAGPVLQALLGRQLQRDESRHRARCVPGG